MRGCAKAEAVGVKIKQPVCLKKQQRTVQGDVAGLDI